MTALLASLAILAALQAVPILRSLLNWLMWRCNMPINRIELEPDTLTRKKGK